MHCSPLMTREKPGSAHRRVIMDLSYPKGKIVNAEIVKDIYLGLPCILTLPTIDNITNITKIVGRAEETSTYSSSGFCTVN